MILLKSIRTIQRIDFLVRLKSTGSAEVLGKKLGVSRRTIFEYLNDLRELGAPVVWSYFENSYIYSEEYSLEFSFNHSNSQKNIKNQPVGIINN